MTRNKKIVLVSPLVVVILIVGPLLALKVVWWQ